MLSKVPHAYEPYNLNNSQDSTLIAGSLETMQKILIDGPGEIDISMALGGPTCHRINSVPIIN